MTRRHATANVPPSRRAGFTLVELLVVIFVIAILVALLVPATIGAIKAANNASVVSELNAISQALASFKNDYGDYPPSRILLCENGFYDISSTAAIPTTVAYRGSVGPDLTYGGLAQRSLKYLRSFFPKAQFSTSAAIYSATTGWHDFNGNGTMDPPYVLSGDECLTFFLGGVPIPASTGTPFAMNGFAKDPLNPFRNSLASGTAMSTDNRKLPYYEFRGERLIDDDGDGIPSYQDGLKTANAKTGRPNFYAYFSAYGNNAYDPNDVNFGDEVTDAGGAYLGAFRLPNAYPAPPAPPLNSYAVSFGPNPYTTGAALPSAYPPAAGVVPTKFVNPQSFQIISAGSDGIYGIGGQFDNTAGSNEKLPILNVLAATNAVITAVSGQAIDTTVRSVEQDNLGNFSSQQLGN